MFQVTVNFWGLQAFVKEDKQQELREVLEILFNTFSMNNNYCPSY